MYLLVQVSFNVFDIIPGSSIGDERYGLCFFLTIGSF